MDCIYSVSTSLVPQVTFTYIYKTLVLHVQTHTYGTCGGNFRFSNESCPRTFWQGGVEEPRVKPPTLRSVAPLYLLSHSCSSKWEIHKCRRMLWVCLYIRQLNCNTECGFLLLVVFSTCACVKFPYLRIGSNPWGCNSLLPLLQHAYLCHNVLLSTCLRLQQGHSLDQEKTSHYRDINVSYTSINLHKSATFFLNSNLFEIFCCMKLISRTIFNNTHSIYILTHLIHAYLSSSSTHIHIK